MSYHPNCRCILDFNPRADFEFIKASIEREKMSDPKYVVLQKDLNLALNRIVDNYSHSMAVEMINNWILNHSDSFTLWGKPITKETARHLIVQDRINSCVNGGDEDHLFYILMSGEEGVENWSNEDISEYLDTLIKENFTSKQLEEAGY